MNHQVVVVGAGLSGIATTRYLQNSGVDVVLLEASERVGGRVASDRIDGYILDHGFQVINPAYSEIVRLNGLANLDFCPINPAIRFSRESGDITMGDPRKSAKYLAAALSKSTGSTKEKLAFLKFLTAKQSLTESFGSASGSFETFLAEVLAPFLRGVFLTDPKNVNAEVVRKVILPFAKATPGVPRFGVGEFSTALAAPIIDLRLQHAVEEISDHVIRTNRGELSADYIVIATDPTTSAQLLNLGRAPVMLASTTWYHSTPDQIDSAKTLVVDGKSPLVNSVVMSEVSEAYAPNGKHLVASTSLEPISESEVRKSLSKLWSSDTRNWDLVAKYDIKQSLPLHVIYPQPATRNDIYIVGDSTALPSQQGALQSGRLAAESIIDQIRQARR